LPNIASAQGFKCNNAAIFADHPLSTQSGTTCGAPEQTFDLEIIAPAWKTDDRLDHGFMEAIP